MTSTTKQLIVLFSVSLLGIIAYLLITSELDKKRKVEVLKTLSVTTLYPIHKPIGKFSLNHEVDDKPSAFTHKSIQGKWHLFFMGYTSCPHICPTEMANLTQLYQNIPKQLQEKIQIIMVTTDPLKDTPSVLKKFVKKFHNDFIGLSGTEVQIKGFAKQFSMPFLPSKETDKTKQYEVNHSATFYLTTPTGELFALYNAPHDVEKITTDISLILSEI